MVYWGFIYFGLAGGFSDERYSFGHDVSPWNDAHNWGIEVAIYEMLTMFRTKTI